MLIKTEETVIATIGAIKAAIIICWFRRILALHIPNTLLTLCLIVLILLLLSIISCRTDGSAYHCATCQAHQ